MQFVSAVFTDLGEVGGEGGAALPQLSIETVSLLQQCVDGRDRLEQTRLGYKRVSMLLPLFSASLSW